MNRFGKSSKYKNAVVNAHKKEKWINDLKVGSQLRSSGNHIKSSCDYVAFVHDSTSIGSLAILPIDACGRFTSFPLISGHAKQVTEFDFSPFSRELLATGSEDGMIKLWSIPNELNDSTRLLESSLSFGPFDAIENVQFHPTASNILAASFGTCVQIFDISCETTCFDLDGQESVVESISWHGNGHLLSTICKSGAEKSVKLFDPRRSKTHISEVKYYNGQRSSCVLCLCDSDFLVTAGSNKMREVELALWSIKSFDKPLCKQNLGSTSSSPSVLYDGDSKMLYAALKSETTVTSYDCSVSLLPGQQAYRGTQQTKGIAMVPKRAMDVMSCEIVRLLQLTQTSIIPISYHIPRKSYSEFHVELYPDTSGDVPAMSAKQWLEGANTPLEKISLDPAKRRKPDRKQETCIEEKKPQMKCEPQEQAVSSAKTQVPTAKSRTFVRSSKFRHIVGKDKHNSTFLTKIPALSATVPGDSNGFQANRDRVAVVLSGSGGRIGIFELKKAGRLDTVDVPTLQNGSAVMDFTFDPFKNTRIVVACEDAKIRVWDIPDNGLTETLTEPKYLIGHRDKANVLSFHPHVDSLLASAGYDGQLLLWDLSSLQVVLSLEKLQEPLFCMAWSPTGDVLATLRKDHFLNIYEPRSSSSPVRELRGPDGSRGARIVWLEDAVIAVSGFNRSGMRTISMYSSNTSSRLSEIVLSVAPSTLIPFFDVDTNLLFLTGKGDNILYAYEYVKSDPPYLYDVSPFNCSGPHQGVAFLPKMLCDVTKVEIAVGVRLTRSSVEGFTIQVPRTRLEYFQDDIFVDTRCVEESSLSLKEWLGGSNAPQRLVSLKPPNMKSLSSAPKEAPAAKKFASYKPEFKTDEQKKEELLSAMIGRMGDKEEDPLPQKNMDGADSDEWSDD